MLNEQIANLHHDANYAKMRVSGFELHTVHRNHTTYIRQSSEPQNGYAKLRH